MIVVVSPGKVVVPPAGSGIVQVVQVGKAGPKGDPGAGGEPVEAVALEPLLKGMPLAIDRATSQMIHAVASYKPKAFVIGIAAANFTAGTVATATINLVTLADWTAATGAAALLPGQLYFLGDHGGMTTVPPIAPSCLTIVGEAISGSTLRLSQSTPLQL